MTVMKTALWILFLNATAFAQIFTADSTTSSLLQPFVIERTAWADVNQDGLLDLFFTGLDSNLQKTTRLFQNNGSAGFTDAGENFAPVGSAVFAFGDFDNDNDLDLFLSGQDSSGNLLAKIYRNDGSGSFVETGLFLPAVHDGAAAWSDFDADGDLDLFYCGVAANALPVAKLFENRGGVFAEITSNLSACAFGSVAVADFNDDGFPDLLLTGRNSSNARLTTLYENSGAFDFTAQNVAFPPLDSSAAAWGDYDNDGDFDLLLAGQADTGPATAVFRNDSTVAFTQLNLGLPGVFSGSALWLDADNDGAADIFISGRRDSTSLSALFLNSGNDTFTPSAQPFDSTGGVASAVDIENDADLDLLLTGTPDSLRNMFYSNLSATPNQTPAPPPTVSTVLTPTALQLQWTAGTDAETPASGLSYNLRIGTTSGGSDIKSPMSLSSGQRQLLSSGNAGHLLSWTLPREQIRFDETIYWSVQSVDAALRGSAFSSEGVFTQPFVQDTLASNVLRGVNAGAADWGDFDRDGDLDLCVTGQDVGNLRIAFLYRNDGNGQFTAIDAGFLGVAASAVKWGDADGDGFPDLLVTGFDAANHTTARLYRNNGDASFTEVSTPFAGVAGGSVLWADLNNDGLQDVLITGLDSQSVASATLYQNLGNALFAVQSSAIPGVILGSVDAFDFDHDGDQDILLTGLNAQSVPIAEIYRNDGAFVFTAMNAGLPGISSGTARRGDYDNDGWADILLSGSGTSGRISTIFKNNGDGTFTDIQPALEAVSNGSAAWGDYDNDGDLDVLLTGQNAGIQHVSAVYRNDGGQFTDIQAWLDGVIFSAVSWADYDNDGDLDILLTGSDPTTRVAQIYRNTTGKANSKPEAPTGLSAQLTDSAILLAWQNAADAETPTGALTYNIRMGTAPQAGDLLPALANSDGSRQIVGFGNAGTATNWRFAIDDILNFPAVYWSVQTVDQEFSGSPFAEEVSLSPIITGIRDVPDDQGGKVQIVWKASALDINVNDLTHYSVWRAIPASQQPASAKRSAENQLTRQRVTPPAIVFNGTNYDWEWLADQPAHRRDTYAYTAETLFDSISTTNGMHFFLVSAHTNDANIFFDSLPDSGYSVDNLPPVAPAMVAGELREGGILVSWQRNKEADVDQYLVYASSVPNFRVSGLAPVTTTKDTAVFIENSLDNGNVYVKVVAEDKNENRSPASEELAFVVTGVAESPEQPPEVFSLQQNYPNPFNPGTQIRYDLPAAALVKLEIFNLKGEKVRTLLNEQKAAGSYVVQFIASDLSSGTYFYRLQAGNFVAVKKMTLLK